MAVQGAVLYEQFVKPLCTLQKSELRYVEYVLLLCMCISLAQ